MVAPTLLVLSGKDKRVPMLQGIDYYNALKARGVVTEYVVSERRMGRVFVNDCCCRNTAYGC